MSFRINDSRSIAARQFKPHRRSYCSVLVRSILNGFTSRDLPRKDTNPVTDPPRPPILTLLGTLENRDDLSLLEPQVPILVGIKGIQRNRLVLSQSRTTPCSISKDWLGGGRSSGLAIRIYIVVLVGGGIASTAAGRVKIVAVVTGGGRATQTSAACRSIVDIVGPSVRATGSVEILVVAATEAAPVAPNTLAVRIAATSLPHHVVMAIVVDWDVIVHGIPVAPSIAEECTRVQDTHQSVRAWGRSNSSTEQLARRDSAIVHFLVGILSFHEHASLQTNTSKESLGLGIGKHRGDTPRVRGTSCFRVAPYRSRGDRNIASQRQGSHLRKGPNRSGIVKDKDEVGQLESNLPSKPGTGSSNGRWGGPRTIGQTRDDHTRSKSSRAEESRFQNSENSQSLQHKAVLSVDILDSALVLRFAFTHLGACQDLRRNHFVGAKRLSRVDEGRKDFSNLLAFAC